MRSSGTITYFYYFPVIGRGLTCQPVGGQSFGTVIPLSDRTLNAGTNPDLNLSVRGYVPTVSTLGLVDYGGDADGNAPQLPSLFADNRTAAITSVYRVYDWDWECMCVTEPMTNYPVTLAGLATTAGEVIRAPGSGYDIGLMRTGYEVMVLYAAANRVTLTYTRNDHIALGYTIHLENVCVDPNLVALYQYWDSRGRTWLPALWSGQGLGRAIGSEIRVSVRDSGEFMDPRSRKDWWQGR